MTPSSMTGLTPILRPLLHHGRMSVAVAAGAAVATAVLAGALLVGDSVRGSLRALTLDRLGGIDHALLGQRFVREDLADDLAKVSAAQPSSIEGLAPAIVLRASVRHATSGARASQIGLQGIDDRFLTLFGDPKTPDLAALLPPDAGKPGAPPVVINTSLQRALDAEIGDAVLISLKRWSEVPRSSLLGRKDTSDVVETVRLTIADVLPDRGLGRFGLAVSQAAPLNAFVALDVLQQALEQQGTVNAVFARQASGADPQTAGAALEAALRRSITLDDLGLHLRRSETAGPVTTGDLEERNHLEIATIESDEFILRREVAASATNATRSLGAPTQPVLTYLANTIVFGDRTVPYSTVAAVDPQDGFPGLLLRDGSAAPALGDDELLLNAWTADDLQTTVGDTVDLTFFQIGPRETLQEATRTFTVRGITAMSGLGIDRDLVQDYPGIADTDNMADWDPPFPVDLGSIRPEDEDYWDEYGDAPKAFVSLATGQALWQSRWGDTTGIRVAKAPDADLASTIAQLGDMLRAEAPLEPLGLAFRAVKDEGLGAAVGATDFAGLFLGFSMFLIVSAALLAALLYRLGVEQRARDLGLELAIGYPMKTLKRRLLIEGGFLATIGALVGTGAAVAYAAAMIHLLRTRWLPAVGTTELRLFVQPATLVAGAIGAILVVLFSIFWTVRRLGKVPATSLLKGVVSTAKHTRSARRTRIVAGISLTLALGLLAFTLVTGRARDAGLFFAIGPLLLVGLLAAFSLLGSGNRRAGAPTRPGPGTLLRMAAANGGRNRGRSMLSTLLVASASFMIVTVAAFQHDYSKESLDRASGAGGFSLVAEADVPLLYDPSDPDGRFELGLPEGGVEGEALNAAHIVPCRLLPGDDTSCLNLYKPSKPRIVGVPDTLIARGGFTFTQATASLDETANPWTLLDQTFDDSAIPAFGDANSMQYILKLPLGSDLVIEGSSGEPVTLRLVATLATSIFQSEMLISEANFLRHFPGQEGFGYLLIETPGADEAGVNQVSQALEAGLVPYGVDAVTTGDKLASFHAVQNTYLSTFRTLGGLGLLLGTVGLAIVLLRNVFERRGELAAMRAFGYQRSFLTAMIVAENALLLLAGLAIGTIAALVTVAPQAFGAAGAHVPWGSIAATLGTVLIVGLVACIVAAAGALRAPLLPALKAE